MFDSIVLRVILQYVFKNNVLLFPNHEGVLVWEQTVEVLLIEFNIMM